MVITYSSRNEVRLVFFAHISFMLSDLKLLRSVWYSTFKWKEGSDRLPEHSGQDYDKKPVLATLRTCIMLSTLATQDRPMYEPFHASHASSSASRTSKLSKLG